MSELQNYKFTKLLYNPSNHFSSKQTQNDVRQENLKLQEANSFLFKLSQKYSYLVSVYSSYLKLQSGNFDQNIEQFSAQNFSTDNSSFKKFMMNFKFEFSDIFLPLFQAYDFQIQITQKQLDSVMAKLDKSQQNITSLQSKIFDYQEENQKLLDELENNFSDRISNNNSNDLFKQLELNNYRNLMNIKHTELEVLENTIQEKDNLINNLKEQVLNQQQIIVDQDQRNKEFHQKVQNQEDQIFNLKLRIKELENNLHSFKVSEYKLQSKVKELQKQILDKQNFYQEQIEIQNKELSQAQKINKDLSFKIEELDQTNQALVSESKNLQNDLQKMKSTKKQLQDNLSYLQQQIKQINLQKLDLDSQLQERNIQLQNLQKIKQELTNKLQKSDQPTSQNQKSEDDSKQMHTEQILNQKKNQELEINLKNRILEQKNQSLNFLNQKITTLQNQIDNYQTSIQEITDQHQKQTKEIIKKFECQLEEQQKKYNELKFQISLQNEQNIKDDHEKKQIKELKAKIISIEQEKRKLQQQLKNEIIQKNGILQKNNSKIKLQDFNNQLRKAQENASAENLQKIKNQYEKKISELNANINSLQDTIDLMKKDYEAQLEYFKKPA